MSNSLSTQPQRIDLIIIGSGPSGISTALHLIQQDPSWKHRLIILEKSEHPRHKLCGGGVTRFGLTTLKSLGVPFPPPIPYTIIEDLNIRYQQQTIHVRGKPIFIIFNREQFDHHLFTIAKKRGIEIKTSRTVSNLSYHPDGILVTTEEAVYLAKTVVGADGSKGITRHFIAPRTNKHHTVARVLEFISPAAPESPFFRNRQALFDFTPVSNCLQGYIWNFPSWENGKPVFNRGIYDARSNKNGAKADLRLLLDRWLDTHAPEHGKPLVMGHPIHGFHPANVFSKPGFILVGDAAGADSLFGEGIAPALGYGKPAACAIQQAFETGDFSFRSYRKQLFKSEVGKYLLLRWLGNAILYRLSRSAVFMHALLAVGGVIAWLWQPKPIPDITDKLLINYEIPLTGKSNHDERHEGKRQETNPAHE